MARVTRRAAMALFVAAVGVVANGGHAQAQEPASPGSGTSCVITGNALVVKDTAVYSEQVGGDPIALFSGALAPLTATRFPEDPTKGRVLINTGAGFRVEGFTDARALTVYGSRDLSVAEGQLWISASTPLKVVGAAPGKVRVELPAGGGLSQPVRAWTTCDALTFTKGSAPLYEVPGQARGYVAKQGSLDIHGEPAGSVVSTIHISGEGNGLLLWGTTVRRGFVHVSSRSSIFIDGWVDLRHVRALPRGELMDQLAPSVHVQSPAQLALKEYQRVMTAPSDIRIHHGRGEATATIGTLEKGAEIYVLETVVGWATVLPKTLHVLPPGDRAFWVRASDLGLATAAAPQPAASK